jgi:P27 family predicted phage terminase small subunit
MGQRGPAGKPVELKVLEGNRGNRPLNLNQMFRPEVGAPSLPKNISREGRKAWRRLVPELLRYNLISLVDADALEELCETIGMIKVLRRSINAKQEKLLAEKRDPAAAIEASTPNGMKVQSVAYMSLKSEREKLRVMLAEFGLTPAQRARVTTAIRVQTELFPVSGGRSGAGGDSPGAPGNGAGAPDGPGAAPDGDGLPRSFADFDDDN